MLRNIKPNRKKTKEGGLTAKEKPLVKGLLNQGYIAQDIVHIVNQGRLSTINLARVTAVKRDITIKASSDKKIQQYMKVQSSYDPKTLLNPYKDARLIRAREAIVCAVQVFNNPTIIFKIETFCVLANIAWTYLLHEKMERTKKNSTKLPNGDSVTLNSTLGRKICPITDEVVIANLQKIIDIRNEVEHTFFVGGEECFGGLFQACCVNFEKYMIEWFGSHLSLSNELSLALQFVSINKDQVVELERSDFPSNINAILGEIQSSKHKDNNAFQATVYYGLESTSKTSAEIHKLIKYSDSESAGFAHVIRAYKPQKLNEKKIVEKLKAKGFKSFSSYHHQQYWKTLWNNAQDRNEHAQEYGELVMSNQWLWYEDKWLPKIIEFCESAGNKYK